MDRIIGSYLKRRGKNRYCDKSLGAARFARLLLRVYPEAKFICLYRNAMDVIASGMEACPWGLNGYGFDPYIAQAPGNAVSALARFWVDHSSQILAVEESFPGQCVRVRYEDLVADPEAIAASVFRFLGAELVPGISETAFSAEHEKFGPGDHKIWYTSKITNRSVGSGWSIPPGLIAPQTLAAIGELSGKLGYVAVGDDWGTSAPPMDLRLPASIPGANSAGAGLLAPARASATVTAQGRPAAGRVRSQVLGGALQAGVARADVEDAHWGPYAAETMVAVWIPSDTHQPAEYWQVDLKNRAVTLATSAAQDNSDWDIIGSAGAWENVISGKVNISVALRSHQLRYCDSDEAGGPLAAGDRLRILAELLSLPRQ